MNSRKTKNFIWIKLIEISALSVVTIFILSIAYLFNHGWSRLTLDFLTQSPEKMMTEGGIFPCIAGTFILSIGSMLVALPLGVACAVWLNEYAKEGRLKHLITLSVANLAGVPSIVFGLFGLSFFVTVCGFGVSAIAGILTLAVLSLPIIINTVNESLARVPNSWREASYALGATKSQTIVRTVLPAALPGIMTGAILALARAAGETSAIMFTATVVSSPSLPNSLFSAVMALPNHIYTLATTGMEPTVAVQIESASALVLLALVFTMNLSAVWLRQRVR